MAGILACTNAPTVDLGAEAQAIRDLNVRFGEAAASKDAEAAVALYAADGVIMAPGADMAKGTEAIRAVWTELLKTPGLAVAVIPEQVDVAASGDLAADMGRLELAMDLPDGPAKEVLKYLVVWKKVDGQWKVAFDTWNANAPAPPPATEAKQ